MQNEPEAEKIEVGAMIYLLFYCFIDWSINLSIDLLDLLIY
jgi:hypothetical protein